MVAIVDLEAIVTDVVRAVACVITKVDVRRRKVRSMAIAGVLVCVSIFSVPFYLMDILDTM